MNCLIQRNAEGNVVKVTTPEGKPSELFKAIHSNIYLGDADTSLRLMANAYSDKFEKQDLQKYETGEPKLFYKAPGGKEFETLESLIISDLDGQAAMGFKTTDGEFTPIAKFDTASSERVTFLTDGVREGVLSADRVLGEDGVTRFQGKGSFTETKKVTAQMVRANALVDLGVYTTVNKDGTLEVEFQSDLVVAEKEKEQDVFLIQDIPSKLNDNTYKNQVDLVVRYLTANKKYDVTQEASFSETTQKAKSILRSLNSFLTTLGFTPTTLEEYRKNYNTKYGKDPDIQAISDMVNRVVAFAEGKVTIEDLSEEVAHIAIEFYNDQNSISGALATVHMTPEYGQYAAYYKEKYAPFYEGLELEDQVRKEVLGKILAKEFKTNFDTANQSEERLSLIDKLLEIFNYFKTTITDALKPHHRKSLDRLNSQIAEAVMGANMAKFNKETSSANFYYNAMPNDAKTIESNLRVVASQIQDMYRRVLKQQVPNKSELERISENMDEISILSSVNTIASIADSQYKVLAANLDKIEANNEPISTMDAKRYDTLTNNILPGLNDMKLRLVKLAKTSTNKPLIDSLVETIDSIEKSKSYIQPRMNQDFENTVQKEFERQFDTSNMTDKEIETVKSQIEGNIRDTTVLGSALGLMSQMQNPVVQMIARVVSDMGQRVNSTFKKFSDPFLEEIYSQGLDKYQKTVRQEKNGKGTFYYWSPIDQDGYDNDKFNRQVEIVTQLTSKDTLQVKQLLEKFTPAQVLKDEKLISEYNKEMKVWKENNSELRFKPEYYEKRKERFTTAGVSLATQEYISNANSNVYDILKQAGALNKNGTIDKSKLSEGDKIMLAAAKRSKAAALSVVDQFGNIKEGLRQVKLSQLTQEEQDKLFYIDSEFTFPGDLVVLENGYNIEDLPEESRVALDSFNLSMLYRKELKEKSKTSDPNDAFKEEVRLQEESGGAFDWISSNATITLNDSYYSNIGSYQSFDVVAQEYINSLPDTNNRDRKQDVLDEYKSLQRSKKAILRQNRKIGNPLETDVINMPGPIQDKLREIDSRISVLNAELDVPQSFFKEVGVSTTRKQVNEDFIKLAKDSPLSEYDFALSHMTEANKGKVLSFASKVRDIVSNKSSYVKLSHERFISDMKAEGKINDTMDTATKVEVLKTEFAKRNVASYFQRYEPNGYEQVMEAFKNGSLKVSEVLDKNKKAELQKAYPALEYMEIVPDYTWVEDTSGEDLNNPLFMPGGYYEKPNVSKYINKDFFKRYGIDMETWLKNPTMDLTQMSPSQNQEEYRLLTLLVEAKKQVIENHGDTGNQSEFLAVQMTASKFEKFARASNWKDVSKFKDSVKDLFQNRKDEKAYGELIDNQDLNKIGSTIDAKIIPKYFQSKVEDPSMLTDNTVAAALIDLKQSVLYTERGKAERTLKALEYKVANQQFISNGGFQRRNRILKEGSVSNYYLKIKEYLDYQLYGIQQSRHFEVEIFGKQVDLTKLGMGAQAWARFSNLAFNPFVDLTSATTGIISNVVDRFAGDYYHKSSANRSNSLLRKHSAKYLAEMGKVNKTSELNQIVEFFGIEDVEGRVKESSFGRGARVINKLPFLGSKAANQPVGPKIILAILTDYRLNTDGSFRSYTEFVKHSKINSPSITKSEIEAAWNKLEKNSFYDYLNITADKVTYNSKFKELFAGSSQAEFDRIVERASAKARQVIQNADGVLSNIDQVAAQRDIIFNPLLMHRGWLLINLTKKFKKQHFNVATGTMEEGHYRTFGRAINELKLKALNPRAVWRWSMEQGGFAEANMKRNLTEVIILAAALALGELIFAADDDDDTVFENMSQLIYLRTISEFASSTAFGIPGSVIDGVKSPFPALSTYEKLNPFKLYDIATTENPKVGFWEQLAKATPAKRANQLMDLQEQVDSFRHFNDNTLFNLGEEKKED